MPFPHLRRPQSSDLQSSQHDYSTRPARSEETQVPSEPKHLLFCYWIDLVRSDASRTRRERWGLQVSHELSRLLSEEALLVLLVVLR